MKRQSFNRPLRESGIVGGGQEEGQELRKSGGINFKELRNSKVPHFTERGRKKGEKTSG